MHKPNGGGGEVGGGGGWGGGGDFFGGLWAVPPGSAPGQCPLGTLALSLAVSYRAVRPPRGRPGLTGGAP